MKKNTLNFGVGETEHAVRDRLLGTWKLIATEETLKDGSTRPFPQFGPNATGFLMYQADGHMCALLVNPDQPKSTVAIEKTLNKKAASFDAAFAYCGRYEIDAGQNTLFTCRRSPLILVTSARARFVRTSSMEIA